MKKHPAAEPDLFDRSASATAPLADRMRPRKIAEMVGQEHLLGEGKLLATAVRADRIPSMVLWGPPGTGKTTLARVIASETRARFTALSAVLGGVAELREAVSEAAEQRRMGRRTVLFVDEIHRFNKAQQDAILPHAENGTVVFIGATTENPSFAVVGALLSRVRVFELQPLVEADLERLLRRALEDAERGIAALGVSASDEVLREIATGARGDARRALDVLEVACHRALSLRGPGPLVLDDVREALAAGTLLHDKGGEGHYNVVSAFIKSMRGSDPDAALYWMLRMLEAGEDPLFVARRMIIFASEDVGNADPRALELAVAADAALQRVGMPEALHALSQCCLYLASTVKSNASYLAWTAVKEDIAAHGALEVPKKLRNAATSHMKAWGYGAGYRYPHDEGGYAEGESYLPERLVGKRYYAPKEVGMEARIRERLQKLRGK